ncbi:type II toxin-antitoxin system RelE/ParE family toxin [Chlorobaculum sp. MV4-Y]|uniref:type II toxin-antitoxin system RelE/ParE family toxin n=1 Tax=Chlorobaculum sp. MV4-Y TaxID=2976335 RepID=UPI0021B062B7|nr:type II toxin-antitoxin system RelE/ParE family toxin [Chlorobaculum sp. MV4-Y]UWX56887.1 type II toxin-antitoxin system RelE/ParE family toxin [Chlorobaculum sp. MV4-Y]
MGSRSLRASRTTFVLNSGVNLRRVCFIVTAGFLLIQFNQPSYFWGVSQLSLVPAEYFKKLKNTDGIWEVRVTQGNNEFRLLGLFDDGNLVILINGFAKKSQKNFA